MKHNIYALALCSLTLLLAGCAGEEADIFDLSAADRLTTGALDATARLASSPAGWAMEYYPTDDTEAPYGLGYLLLTDFNADGSVTMAMNNEFSDNVYIEDTSAWEVITDNGVVLTYNTYNACIHAFCDPEDIPSTDSDETGYGCEGDYEFIVVNIPEETEPEYLMLKGKKRGVYVRLSRLDAGTIFQEYMEDVQAFNDMIFPSSAPNYLVLTIGDDVMEVDDMATGIPNIYEFGTDAISNECYYPYLVTKHNGRYYLRFRDAVLSPKSYTTQELVYDEEQDSFIDVDDSNITLTGPAPFDFFIDRLQQDSRWQIRRTSEMSAAATNAFEDMYNGLSTMGYTLQYARLSLNDDGDVLCSLTVRASSGATTTVAYQYAATISGSAITLSYVAPTSTAAENVLGNVPAILDFLTLFNGTSTIVAAPTRFDLSNVRLNTADSNIWLVLSLS